MRMEKLRYITQAWLVILLSLCFGGALAAVQSALQPRIEENRLNDTLQQIPRLVAGAERGEPREVEGLRLFEAVSADGERVGWVRPAGGPGFADRIELLVGLDPEGRTVTGLYILEQKETPGLGNRITETPWLDQFRGRPVEPRLRLVKGADGGADGIEAVTGATISSQSVLDIVNEAVRRPLPTAEDNP